MAGPHDHAVQSGLAQHALALLLGAPVRGLHRQRLVLAQHAAVRLTGDDGRGEHEALHARGLRGLEQPPCSLHVHLVDLLRVTLRGDLRGEVHHALRRVPASESLRWTGAVRSPTTAVVPSGSEPGRRTSASTSCPRAVSSRQAAWPTNPLAPVTRTRTRRTIPWRDGPAGEGSGGARARPRAAARSGWPRDAGHPAAEALALRRLLQRRADAVRGATRASGRCPSAGGPWRSRTARLRGQHDDRPRRGRRVRLARAGGRRRRADRPAPRGAGRRSRSSLPRADGNYIWTRKQANVPARGHRSWSTGRRRELDGVAFIDDSAGYHPRHTAWMWSAGNGLDDGRPRGRVEPRHRHSRLAARQRAHAVGRRHAAGAGAGRVRARTSPASPSRRAAHSTSASGRRARRR